MNNIKKNVVLFIWLTVIVGIGCSPKAVDGVSYIRNNYETTFVDVLAPNIIHSDIILMQDEINEVESEGIYSWIEHGNRTSLLGKWVLVNDTLTLYPELYAKIDGEKGGLKYWPLNKENRSIDAEVMKFKVRNDTLYDITDYTEFYKYTAKMFGIGADYKYRPENMVPYFKLRQYKRTK